MMIPTAAALRRAADIKDQIQVLNREFDQIFVGRQVTPEKSKIKRRCMSQQARDKIAAAARRRWRMAKRAGRKTL